MNRKTRYPPHAALPALESVAKHMRDRGHVSSADELFKERAAVIDLLNAGQEWLHAASPESRTQLKRAFAKFGVTP
jgi:hypothetical protein